MRYHTEYGVSTTIMNDGGLILLSERSGKLYRGNSTAAAMWRALDRCDGQLDAAVAVVAAQYDVASARVRTDLGLLVSQMCQAGLLRAEA